MARATALARKQAAKDFAQRWKGRGYEKGDTASFWLELLRDVVGMEDVTTNVRFEDQTVDRGFIDVTIRDAKTIIEQKSLGVDLDKAELRQGMLVTPFEQAKRYADSLRNSERPDTIIVCDFNEFRIHDLDVENPGKHFERFTLDELDEQLHLLDFLIDPQLARRKREVKVSLDAGMLIGKLYDMVREQYIDPDSAESMHSLNVLCVRLVFLLFAEDAGLFKKDSFYRYLKPIPADRARLAIKELFSWLNTPVAERDPYASAALKEFPYVNGGLFEAEVEVPSFTPEIVDFLLDEVSEGTDWSQISPTVFGGVFESTLNPETRRKGGMHYTSPENIHKVIGPLFLDELKAELEGILTDESFGERARRNRLQKFHDKIASLTFFDPACGSGNFLTETYIQLRKLENKILSELQRHQGVFAFTEELSPLKISLRQFHGIEINDFAVNVASTALWIAELQANAEAQSIVYSTIKDLPLQDSANIVHGNALQIEWSEVLDPSECDYIIGNPPFVGHQYRSEAQQIEMATIFDGLKGYGKLDYVCAWFEKAQVYMGQRAKAALVATNSICQGESVGILWRHFADCGVEIDFAWLPFVWDSEAHIKAHVHVVIVGFSRVGDRPKLLFDGNKVSTAEHINGYLAAAPDVFIENRGRPINRSAPAMTKGNQPTDGGHLILSDQERIDLLAKYPDLDEVILPYVGGREFINNKWRWCLWFFEKNWRQFAYPEIKERLRSVVESRLKSPTKSVREAAATPELFTQIRQPRTSYIAIPEVSSSRRLFVPIGYLSEDIIASNQLRFIPSESKYIFGLLCSRVHNAWVRVVAGRLKSDFRYSPAVYNSFVFPVVTGTEHASIAAAGQAVLDARAQYPDATLEDLYEPDDAWMYPALMNAHSELDAAVERAYGLPLGCDEKEIVKRLFELYDEAVKA